MVWLGNTADSLDIGDLPIVPVDMRSTFNYGRMRKVLRTVTLRFFSWTPRPGSGWQLSWMLIRLNSLAFAVELLLAAISAVLYYSPAYFLQSLIAYLEINPGREDKGWGWVYVVGLFTTTATLFLSMLILISSTLSYYVTISYRPALVSFDYCVTMQTTHST